MTDREAFLAGDRPDDVAIYLSDAALGEDGSDRVASLGERVEDGVLLVVPGESGRDAFEAATGIAPMAFARRAGSTDGTVDRSLDGGTCPAAGVDGTGNGSHAVAFCLAFAQAETEAAGGIYTEGDVIHAYAECTCGTAYADRWLAGENSAD